MHTGDAGYIDARGFVFLVDRVKDMIVTGGENVYSAEVENVIYQHPAVHECAVIGVPSDAWGEAVHAIVVTKPGMRVTPDELIAFCRAAHRALQGAEVVRRAQRRPAEERRGENPQGRSAQTVLDALNPGNQLMYRAMSCSSSCRWRLPALRRGRCAAAHPQPRARVGNLRRTRCARRRGAVERLRADVQHRGRQQLHQ